MARDFLHELAPGAREIANRRRWYKAAADQTVRRDRSLFRRIARPETAPRGRFSTQGGWLNCDIARRSMDSIFLDVTKPFPVETSTIDYAFSEHIIARRMGAACTC